MTDWNRPHRPSQQIEDLAWSNGGRWTGSRTGSPDGISENLVYAHGGGVGKRWGTFTERAGWTVRLGGFEFSFNRRDNARKFFKQAGGRTPPKEGPAGYWTAQIVRGSDVDSMSDEKVVALIKEHYARLHQPRFSLAKAIRYGVKLHHTRTVPSDISESEAFIKQEASIIRRLLRK